MSKPIFKHSYSKTLLLPFGIAQNLGGKAARGARTGAKHPREWDFVRTLHERAREFVIAIPHPASP